VFSYAAFVNENKQKQNWFFLSAKNMYTWQCSSSRRISCRCKNLLRNLY